jgi:hypothetical protein
MYTHVSKCKNNKIQGEKGKGKKKESDSFLRGSGTVLGEHILFK